MANTQLTAEEEKLLKWQFGMHGSFMTALFKAMEMADETNLEALSRGFPAEVSMLRRYRTEDGWWDQVLAKAKELGIVSKNRR